ncbi:protein abrupt-like [Pseudomyrmex gracilis]|uniref:protein abrupt-like n=1 Tax=Pseudomyrmex gracilis TaxID=219809 RepID=UPI000995B985|nr:protein abrupt-like [Pseudomyrmex gracilis]XP_020287828.1 protein abrupt-like [Pseudomyrmex gracilis]
MATVLASKEFSLKWNNFSNNLTSGFLSHLNENNLVDVTLAVEGQLVAAHKLVLSVCSPYFKNIFKEYPCQHPVIILKDVKHAEVTALLKFIYQGEVNVRQEDLPMFLKVAQMLQIKGLEGGDRQIIPLLNDYVSVSDLQCNSKDVTALSDISEQESSNKTSEGSTHSHRIIKKNSKKRKIHTTENDFSSAKELRNEPNISNKNNVFVSSDNNDEQNLLDSEENITHDDIESNNAVDDDDEIVELTNESNLAGNSTQSAVEPVIYRLSARGRPQLVHEGYVYNLTSRSEQLNRSHYRCAEQHRGCRGKCSVIAESFMPTGVHNHNHPPGYQSEYDYRKKKGLDTDNV